MSAPRNTSQLAAPAAIVFPSAVAAIAVLAGPPLARLLVELLALVLVVAFSWASFGRLRTPLGRAQSYRFFVLVTSWALPLFAGVGAISLPRWLLWAFGSVGFSLAAFCATRTPIQRPVGPGGFFLGTRLVALSSTSIIWSTAAADSARLLFFV